MTERTNDPDDRGQGEESDHRGQDHHPDHPADDLRWRTLDTRTDYTCPGFDVMEEEVALPDGTREKFHYLTEPPSVVVLPFTDGHGGRDGDGDGTHREVVVIEEWRQAVGRVNRGFPAGGFEPDDDDDLAATARRELAEETGYEAGAVDHLVTYEAANGVADVCYHYYVARECTPSAEQRLDHNESIRVETTSFRELLRSTLDGCLRDGRTALGVLQYAMTRATDIER